MFEKDMENEAIQGFKEISKYSSEFEDSSNHSFGLESFLDLVTGLGLIFGLLCGIFLFFKK